MFYQVQPYFLLSFPVIFFAYYLFIFSRCIIKLLVWDLSIYFLNIVT